VQNFAPPGKRNGFDAMERGYTTGS